LNGHWCYDYSSSSSLWRWWLIYTCSLCYHSSPKYERKKFYHWSINNEHSFVLGEQIIAAAVCAKLRIGEST
jgi:hypothetical protein